MSKTIGTLEDFCDWLSTMPAEEEYDWTKIMECALTQYFRSRGLPCHWTGLGYWVDGDFHKHVVDTKLFTIAVNKPPFTFGAAHTRALEALAND